MIFLVSAVETSFLNLIYHGAGTVVYLLLLKFSMARLDHNGEHRWTNSPRYVSTWLFPIHFRLLWRSRFKPCLQNGYFLFWPKDCRAPDCVMDGGPSHVLLSKRRTNEHLWPQKNHFGWSGVIKIKKLFYAKKGLLTSVTRTKSPNVYKNCPKMISLEKW